MRKWLNGEFIPSSFLSEVVALLFTSTITTDEYNVQSYDGWNEKEITVTTEDKVYIPSVEDVENYGLKSTSLLGKNDDMPITGWLRNRGYGIAFQVSFELDGSYGSEWLFSSYGIRSIIKISLDGNASLNLPEASNEDSINADENDSSITDTSSPFSQDYWEIFTEGFRGDRIEASSMDYLLPSDHLYIVWDSSLYLNDISGTDDCNQYFLDVKDEGSQKGTYSHFSDHATDILGSNLDVYDSNVSLVL